MAAALQGLERLAGKAFREFNTDMTEASKRVDDAIAAIRQPLIDRYIKVNAVDLLVRQFEESYKQAIDPAAHDLPDELGLAAYELWDALWPHDDVNAPAAAEAQSCQYALALLDAIVADADAIRTSLQTNLVRVEGLVPA